MKKIFLIALFILTVAIPVQAAHRITLAWEGADDPTISYLLFTRAEGEDYDYNNPVWSGYEQTCTVNVSWDTPTYFVVRAYDDVNDVESGDSNEVMFDITDTDEDGLPDVVEDEFGTDPNNPDSDEDGINDGDEYEYWGSPENLLIADVDGDGYLDGEEINNGGDPSDPTYGPASVVYEDAEDGSIDRWEVDQKKSYVENIFDEELDSRVIHLYGKRYKKPFHLTNLDSNTQLFVISCKIMYSNRFKIVITVKTKSGHDKKFMLLPGRSRVKGKRGRVKVFLGTDITRNAWHSVQVDLQEKLEKVQPDEELSEITGLYIFTRKDFKIDNLTLNRTTLN